MTQSKSVLGPVAAAALLFSGFFYLGFWVTAHGEPPALLSFAHAVVGHQVNLAWAFTNAGWPPVLGPLFVCCIVVAARSPRWRVRALYVLAVTLICWGAADGFQHFFARPRRDDWIIRHEHAFSYPSSHAAMATGFYALWGVMLLRSEFGRAVRYCSFIALLAMALGIMWSRLALGAHYPTDVLGGVMLGATISLLGAAAVRIRGGRLTGQP